MNYKVDSLFAITLAGLTPIQAARGSFTSDTFSSEHVLCIVRIRGTLFCVNDDRRGDALPTMVSDLI